ncbi:DUF1552 domain-containing protein [Parahaliea aestuarii]|uniref:DUF1552 domain-containing protein n=1 Tax=Parahaliea aestuarii TaxID=1852021 RepID=A0A5C9A1E9_9GAMM|nr:DUF1552 domain-containing protein [Parahaliea aestuarii]TXS94683.1 DUF1552 domain-containing protein [Parahaliea aestuarii]
MSKKFTRRSLLRGTLGGTAVCMGLPLLDVFLNSNASAYASGARLPVRFGTYFWGLGLTDTPAGGTRWVPATTGPGYEITPELKAIAAVKDKVSVFSGFRAIPEGRANLVHWSGHASILSGVAPTASGSFDEASFDTRVADALGGATRFKSVDIDASMSRTPVSYSTRSGKTFASPEVNPLGLYTRLFGAGFQDPNSDNWQPDPSIMLRQSVLSAVKEQRQALMSTVGQADRIKLDQFFSSVRDMENQLAVQLERPEKREACNPPVEPGELPRGASVDVVNENTRLMARLLAMGMACDQTRAFNFVHTSGASETYMAGNSKIYHQITHDEPTDAKLGYQPETSRLAEQVMEGFGAFLEELDAVPEGDGTLLDNTLVMAFSDTGYAKIHSIDNIPMFLAGGAGGRHRAGQHIHQPGEPVTRVSLTAMQLVDTPVGEFGRGTMKTARPVSEVMA